jgi:uncharacterized protein (DUF1330 family)
MAAYLINHLRIPNGIPKPEGLEYLERVEATFARYGGRWLVLDAQVDVVEGAWPGSVANLKSSSYRCPTLIGLGTPTKRRTIIPAHPVELAGR